MTENAHAYLPMDRRVALAAGRDLPTDVWGSALEADLSGFTALTESLARELGEQRGAEELTRRLNVLYDGLLHELHRFGGTVLGFSGDAFTSWFDSDDGMRSVACARSLQSWMVDFAQSVSPGVAPPQIKVAVATGPTRRFLVGDPAVQLIEGLAGSLVDELAAVGHEARPGEVVLAPSSRSSLGPRAETGERGVLRHLAGQVSDAPWPDLHEDATDLERIRPWLLPAVFERLAMGEGDFLAELRPATALFLRFSGIGFEADPTALSKLDAFVRAVQSIVSEFEGTLVQLTIGDKGSYLYAAFGAPVAHEDDPVRALLAARALRRLGGRRMSVDPVSIGVATGRLRSGEYGGAERRTYGVLGDTVNLAARLMQAAAPGEIIATREVREMTATGFTWTTMPDLTVKGKSRPVSVARLRGLRSGLLPGRRWQSAGPAAMLGRQAELDELKECIARAVGRQGQVVAITAEAGMGKTRLITELLRSESLRGFAIHQAACPSFGVNGSYVAWRSIWHRLLGIPQGGPARGRVNAAAAQLARADLALLPRLPLLSPLLGLAIPENDLTASFDPKVRKTSLEATLAEWLRATADQPMLIVLEDCHWIDALSEDLLEVISRTVRELPVALVVTHRPRSETEGGEFAIARQSHYREIALGRLSDQDVDGLIRTRLAGTTLPKALVPIVARLAERAEGNPFYVGELLEYILGLGPEALVQERLAELPSSLQNLVLSRIDRLDEPPRSTLKVASAVGRVFEPGLLAPVHPGLGRDIDVSRHLAALQRADFVYPEADHLYGFKHAITQEVAYSTIVGDTRAALHGRIGRVLEGRAGPEVDRQLDLLAYHFGRSDDDERRRRYVLLAAESAQARYANRAAAEYYRNVLPLIHGAERGGVLLNLGRTLGLMGAWDEAATAFQEASDRALERGDIGAQARAETEQGELARKQGRYRDASEKFEGARAKLESMLESGGEATALAEVLHYEGTLAAQQGETGLARSRYEASLETRRRLGDRRGMARSLNGLGIVAEYEGQLAAAAALYEEALAILVELGDTWGESALTNNAGMVLLLQGRPTEARPLFERAVALQREVGDPHMLANFLSNLGDAARELGDGQTAVRCYQESLVMARELGERWLIAYLLEDVAMLAVVAGRATEALRLAAAGARLRQDIGAPLPPEGQRKLDERLEPARMAVTPTQRDVAVAGGAAVTGEEAVNEALLLLDGEHQGWALSISRDRRLNPQEGVQA